ncbi:hypothetical protein ISCGN_025067 [Ixodes scapularis]
MAARGAVHLPLPVSKSRAFASCAPHMVMRQEPVDVSSVAADNTSGAGGQGTIARIPHSLAKTPAERKRLQRARDAQAGRLRRVCKDGKPAPKTPAMRKREQRARERSVRQPTNTTPPVSQLQPSTSRALDIATHHAPVVPSASPDLAPRTSGPHHQSTGNPADQPDSIRVAGYDAYHTGVDDTFRTQFINNLFGHVCEVCDKLWFRVDLATASQVDVLHEDFVIQRDRLPTFKLCSTCCLAPTKYGDRADSSVTARDGR